ncbi:MAG: AgmX/PglI C-terminal domain-containing protein [Polyangiales bacterium]
MRFERKTLGVMTAMLLTATTAAAQDPPAATTVTLGDVVFLGEPYGVEAAQVAAAMNRRMPAMRQCYARSLAGSPTLAGEMQIDVTFGRNGRATAVTATGLGSVPAVSQCVAAAVRGASFPRLRPREAQSLRFLVPVTFQRAG